ncbi:uncharacterized protein LOC134844348 isoform X2 [Symsagittifera roscoffensis]|uniref:uncharacterized protein LOC134844348 isoform X2 n=1 Tax=Symsagittifera roscoffensis TaxID=84072 RepID=UPI00307B1AB5
MSQQQNSSARSVTFNDEQTAAQQQDDSCRMKQMTELRESSAFIRRHPESLLFVACKVFQALDADNNSQISWPEIEDSFLGNLENIPFDNKEQLKECFYKWASVDENSEELSFDEFLGFFQELIEMI